MRIWKGICQAQIEAPNTEIPLNSLHWTGTAGHRALFGVLNTLLFFPSGAVAPISGFPKWLRAIAVVDPFTYAVHGFQSVLLKDGGFTAIWMDLVFLFGFGILTLLIATSLFKRTI